jgi:hypothetical protein
VLTLQRLLPRFCRRRRRRSVHCTAAGVTVCRDLARCCRGGAGAPASGVRQALAVVLEGRDPNPNFYALHQGVLARERCPCLLLYTALRWLQQEYPGEAWTDTHARAGLALLKAHAAAVSCEYTAAASPP